MGCNRYSPFSAGGEGGREKGVSGGMGEGGMEGGGLEELGGVSGKWGPPKSRGGGRYNRCGYWLAAGEGMGGAQGNGGREGNEGGEMGGEKWGGRWGKWGGHLETPKIGGGCVWEGDVVRGSTSRNDAFIAPF